MKTNAEAGQFTKEDLDAAVSSTFIPISSSPMGRYISSISFGDYYDDLDSFRLVREGTDKFGFTSYDVRLKLKSGKEYSLRDRYDEQGQSKVQRPKSGKVEFRLDERPYSESKGLYVASSYVLEADRAKDVQYKVENPRGTSDYTESDSRWGTRWYNFRNPAVGRGDYTLEGDIPFSGRQSFGMNPNQLFINGFPVDEQGNRITPGGSDASFGNIGVSIGTTPINYNDPNKASIATPIIGGAAGRAGVYTASDGTRFTDQSAFSNYQKMLSETSAAQQKKLEDRRSAFQILREEFTRYGLGQLVGDIENLLIQGTPPAEYAFQLRQTPTYKQRFAANDQRIKKGLRVLDEASYIGLEDQYQDVMRRYGLPETYYSRDDIGTQKGFERLIAANVSNVELEKRIQNTQSRIFDANPEVMTAMRQFYPNITGGEILAYALDPETALPQLERKIAAAEIGGAALQAGLTTSLTRAEELAAADITKAKAQEQYGKIASGLERGKRLSEIYQQPTYTQEVAEAEAFALPNAEQARRQRRKLGQLETAEFGGTSGVTGGALGRERAGQY